MDLLREPPGQGRDIKERKEEGGRKGE